MTPGPSVGFQSEGAMDEIESTMIGSSKVESKNYTHAALCMGEVQESLSQLVKAGSFVSTLTGSTLGGYAHSISTNFNPDPTSTREPDIVSLIGSLYTQMRGGMRLTFQFLDDNRGRTKQCVLVRDVFALRPICTSPNTTYTEEEYRSLISNTSVVPSSNKDSSITYELPPYAVLPSVPTIFSLRDNDNFSNPTGPIIRSTYMLIQPLVDTPFPVTYHRSGSDDFRFSNFLSIPVMHVFY